MNPRYAVLIIAILLAGCTEPSPAMVVPTDTVEMYGSLLGRAVDDELVPLPNITITLVESASQTLTAADGSFSFGDVPIGEYSVAATHPMYEETLVEVDVVVDEETVLELGLVKKPEYRPFNLTVPLEGQFECGAELPIITGPCWTFVEGVSCGAPVNNCVTDPVFKSKYEFRFDVAPRWETLVAELVWTSGATAMDGMRMYVENTNVSAQGAHGTAVSKVHGNKQPLTLRIDRGQPALGHETYAGGAPAYIPDEGGTQQIRVFPKGQAYDQTSQVCSDSGCLLGVGVGMDVTFTVYLTIFYNQAAPAGFSAVPTV